MRRVVTHCYMGARDLYHGVPDLEGAQLVAIEHDSVVLSTTLRFELKSGEKFELMIVPAE